MSSATSSAAEITASCPFQREGSGRAGQSGPVELSAQPAFARVEVDLTAGDPVIERAGISEQGGDDEIHFSIGVEIPELEGNTEESPLGFAVVDRELAFNSPPPDRPDIRLADLGAYFPRAAGQERQADDPGAGEAIVVAGDSHFLVFPG